MSTNIELLGGLRLNFWGKNYPAGTFEAEFLKKG